MAGDHKCPVCQATFTRPQHVARHMRSHTGDRPYKCQHCGDQFARSDLLSRHVNKCHPNEKPLVSSTPSRRKGTASASRATTSKQACDQCVQSTLPCDGANPCSKCIHRKTRCTYVKFHRQTAPLGPGHPTRSAHDSSIPAHPSLGAHLSGSNPYRLSDTFFLANSGSALNPSPISHSNASAPNPLYAGHQFTFPPPLQVSTSSYDNTFDYTARYRAQADLLSRTGVIPQERAPPLPAIYQDSQAPNDPNSVPRYTQSYHIRNDPQDYPLPPSPSGVDYGYTIKSDPYSTNPLNYPTNGYNHPTLTLNHDTQSHQRSESSASDTGSTTSHSQPSSAASSSIHLPLAADYPQQSFSRPATADGVVPERENFSSAFGLMSLDDSDVLAGFGDGAPFFDNAITNGSSHNPSWGDGPTPRANPCDAPPGNGKKGTQLQLQQQQDQATPGNLKELKEMWKQYLKTPLSGQPLAHEHHPAGSPKRERGLSRVASLPSVKTPAATASGGDPMRGANGGQHQQHQQPQQQPANGAINTQYGAYSRTHNHTDDLRSYEQAVLARRAPLTLHLAPRRRGNTTSTGPPSAQPPPSSATSVTALPPPTAVTGKGSRASPAGSGSGSDRSMSVFTDDRASSSRGSPTGSRGSVGYEDPSRPTFKRLPSQTLGPEYTKRTATASMLSGARSGFPSVVNEPEMRQRDLERARRMSFPSGRAGLVGLQD